VEHLPSRVSQPEERPTIVAEEVVVVIADAKRGQRSVRRNGRKDGRDHEDEKKEEGSEAIHGGEWGLPSNGTEEKE
jgi:hypothetical protein